MTVFLDVNRDEGLIIARFTYARKTLEILSGMPGVKVKKKGIEPDPDESYFTAKLNWDNALAFRQNFGDDLEMTIEMKAWGHVQKNSIGKLRKLATAEDADLKLVPIICPEMYELITVGNAVSLLGERKPAKGPGKPRVFQKADIAFAAHRKNSGNFNHPGLGKTITAIGAIAESGCIDGPNLVVCPVVSRESVWQYEWESWVRGVPALVVPDGREARTKLLRRAMHMAATGQPFILIVNPAMVKYRSEFDICEPHDGLMCATCEMPEGHDHESDYDHRFVPGKKPRVKALRDCEECDEKFVPEFPELFDIKWKWAVFDEIQEMGLADMSSMTYKGISHIPAEHDIWLSGTPFGGKFIHVYNVLHLISPKDFSNKMDFANRWANVTRNGSGFGNPNAKIIGEMKSCHRHQNAMSDEDLDCELCDEIRQPFWDMLSSWAVRRTKSEYIPELPDKIWIDKWVDMTPKQEIQYKTFEKEAEVTIDKYDIGAVGILAEYARLKQFAGAVQEVEIIAEATIDKPTQYKLHPTEDCPKLPEIHEIMRQLGIIQGEPVGGEMQQLVIFSESVEMLEMVNRWVNNLGVASELLTGKVAGNKRGDIIKRFQNGHFRVICVNIKAAGFSINLDRADTAIFLDETWNPDKQEQAEDRLHRGSRIHQVTIYYIRTKGTIQEDIRKTTARKDKVNRVIMKIRKNVAKRLGKSETSQDGDK